MRLNEIPKYLVITEDHFNKYLNEFGTGGKVAPKCCPIHQAIKELGLETNVAKTYIAVDYSTEKVELHKDAKDLINEVDQVVIRKQVNSLTWPRIIQVYND